MKKRLYHLFPLVIAALVVPGGTKAHAQIIGSIEANIPFPFYVGNGKFPPGKYSIQDTGALIAGTMEISSADGKSSALFETLQSRDKTIPQTTELIFSDLHGRYFLTELYDREDRYGAKAIDAGYSKMYKAATEGAELKHVAAVHSK
jgi:hypothetical protein